MVDLALLWLLFVLDLPPSLHVEYCLAVICCFQISYADISRVCLEAHTDLYCCRDMVQRVRLYCPNILCGPIAPFTPSKATVLNVFLHRTQFLKLLVVGLNAARH
jgi:hypothetical protein